MQMPRGPIVSQDVAQKAKRPNPSGDGQGRLYQFNPGDDRLSHPSADGQYHGPGGLNYRIRDGNWCGPFKMDAGLR